MQPLKKGKSKNVQGWALSTQANETAVSNPQLAARVGVGWAQPAKAFFYLPLLPLETDSLAEQIQ